MKSYNILSTYLNNKECVQTHSDIFSNPFVGLFSSVISVDGENKIIHVNNGILIPKLSYANLSGSDFSLQMTKSGLKFWLRDDTVSIPILDTITEEWFFQLCTIHDFGSLQYSDIEFVKDVYTKLCTGE